MMIDSGKSAQAVIETNGLAQVSDDSTLEKIVDQVISENPKVVSQVKEGKDTATGFLVGQAMRKSQGKGNPKKMSEIIRRRLFHG